MYSNWYKNGYIRIAETCICVKRVEGLEPRRAGFFHMNSFGFDFFIIGGYLYKRIHMKVSKMGLIKMVLAESTIDDVLSGSWQQQANQSSDIEFYKDKTEVFWKMVGELLGVLRNMPYEEQEEWADYYKFSDDLKNLVYEWLARADVLWFKGQVTNEFVYKHIKERGLDSDNAEQMYELANDVVPYAIKKYVG